MSASLVGSEMCIRDSPSRSDQLATRGVLRGFKVCFRAEHARPWGPARSCLLYTSDAADDM
eukprot:14195293-Alexandrium_andersonii.AAC.1